LLGEARTRRARWCAGLAQDAAKLRFVQTFYEFPPAALFKDNRGDIAAAPAS
jgi:hypothetical protein